LYKCTRGIESIELRQAFQHHLEEMTGRAVPKVALYYAETKRRTEVRFDAELPAHAVDFPRASSRPPRAEAANLLPRI
jgi:hypothetical protein